MKDLFVWVVLYTIVATLLVFTCGVIDGVTIALFDEPKSDQVALTIICFAITEKIYNHLSKKKGSGEDDE